MNYKYLSIAIFLAINLPAYAQVSDLPTADKSEVSDKKVSIYSESEELAPVDVYGETIALDGIMTDEQGYDAVYDDNYSSDFVGKKRIEAYRGTTPSDLLSSFAGVYSGDSRNSGAIDPNIRGIQGEERVKTRIDGTEQAISINRGFNGAVNRNFIDPMLTSSIRIVKDSGLDTGVQTGTGGGMEIRTLNVNDFIDKDTGFGGEIRIETSSGATKPRIRDFDEGKKVINIPGTYIDGIDNLDIDAGTGTGLYTGVLPNWHNMSDMGWDYFIQPNKDRSNKDQYNVFSGEDIAARIALGYKGTNWDVMGAVAVRDRGNYFAGGNAADYYNAPRDSTTNNTTRSLAKYFKPGMDTFNSSNKMTSYLFKTSWQPTEEQKISFKARRSDSIYGEILPQESHASADDDISIQWPLSKVDASTYSLQYYLNPSDNDWVDLSTNLWMTKTKTRAYNSGASVFGIDAKGTAAGGLDNSHFKSYDPATGRVTWDVSDLLDDTLIDTGYVATKNTRKGIDISNRFKLNENLNVTAFGSLQREDIKSDMPFLERTPGILLQVPREGRRQEYGLGFNVNWQATDKLTLDVGAQYNSYWMMDDRFDKYIKAGKFTEYEDHEIYYEYTVKTEDGLNDYMNQWGFVNCNNAEDCANKKLDEIGADTDKKQEALDNYNFDNRTDYTEFNDEFIAHFKDYQIYDYNNMKESYEGETKNIKWEKDSNGRYSLANNPCYDGRINNNIEGIIKNQDGCPGVRNYGSNTRTISSIEKSKGHQWTPALALNYQVNDNINVYARYNESVRFPSTREGMISFASDSRYLSEGGELRPEHSHKFEVGYVHNLADILPSAEFADVKLAYYQNNMTDVIDKNTNKHIFNLEKKKTKGLELQARYDSGKFFSDLGVNYVLENKVCDESTAALTEAINGPSPLGHVPQCVQDGFYDTFSLTHAVPKLSTKLHLGTRLLDKKLTLGARFTYYNKVDLDDFNNYLRISGASEESIKNYNNPIYGWDNTFLVDAYARYKINKNFSVELSGNNLTDQYFVDPASRTAMPAPGRSFKLGFTGRF